MEPARVPYRGVAEKSSPSPKFRVGSREELPHVRGQGRWPRGTTPCLSSGAAKRSYPKPEVRAVAKRSYPTPEVRAGGREEQPHAQGQPHVRGRGQRRGATPCPRPGVAAGRSYPTSKEPRLCRRRRAERSYSTFKVWRGSHEEIPLVQGKEQRLCFAGAAVKRYPTSRVRETQIRREVLQKGIRGQTH